MLLRRKGTRNTVSRRFPALCRQAQCFAVIAWKKRGEPCWVRTSDLLIKSQLLYRLS